MKNPRISVLLPARNVEAFLPETLDSLWAQSFTDFEVIAVDDASTDDTFAMLKSFALREKRLRVFRNRRNLGIALTLNVALAKSRAPFLARMDADDRAHPRRFAAQLQRFESDATLGVIGTAVRLWRGNSLKYLGSETSHEGIKARFIFQNVMAHPTVMIRRSALGSLRYRDGYYATEDYDLWTRMIGRTRFANLKEALLDYRVHPQQSGPSRARDQYEAATRVRWEYLKTLGIRMNRDQRILHASACPPDERHDLPRLPALKAWLTELMLQNRRLNAVDGAFLRNAIEGRFAAYSMGSGIQGLVYYLRAGGPLRSRHALGWPAWKSFAKYFLRLQGRRV